jgi:hypothetical protein
VAEVGQESLANQKSEMQVAGEGVVAPGIAKGKGKPYCYRCLTKGHVNTECTTVISCGMCDSGNHVTKACPYQKGAKPTAILCGYAVERLGFYYIPFEGKQQVKSDNRLAVVKVTKGSMTAAQVVVELDRLLPSYKGSWIVEEKGQNMFTTMFPSSDELIGWYCGVRW